MSEILKSDGERGLCWLVTMGGECTQFFTVDTSSLIDLKPPSELREIKGKRLLNSVIMCKNVGLSLSGLLTYSTLQFLVP